MKQAAKTSVLIVCHESEATFGAAVRSTRTPTPGSGPGPARNAAFSIARGTFIAPLDADGTWSRERLARLIELAERHEVTIDDTTLLIEGKTVRVTIDRREPGEPLRAEHTLKAYLPM